MWRLIREAELEGTLPYSGAVRSVRGLEGGWALQLQMKVKNYPVYDQMASPRQDM